MGTTTLYNYLANGGRVVPRRSTVDDRIIGAYVMHTSNDAILGAYTTLAEAREACALANHAQEMAKLCRDIAEGDHVPGWTDRAREIIAAIAAQTKGGG